MSRKPTILGLAIGFLLIVVISVLVFAPRDPLEPYLSRVRNPPPLTATVGTNKGPVLVFSGHMGCFIIPPDGSLWRWGQAGGYYQFARTNLPELIGTNHDWIYASAGNGNCVGITTNGGLWNWGLNFAAPPVSSTPVGNWLPAPQQVGNDHNWVFASSGGDHSVALKQNGTLWAWGYDSDGQMGNGLGPEETNIIRWGSSTLPHIRTNLIQVGTNNDWTAINAELSYTTAIRSDGTLWVWGRIRRLLNGQSGGVFPIPTQVCRETNWLALQWDGSNLETLALNRNGELWRLFDTPPQPLASVATVGELLASNCVPNRFAIAVEFYQLRSDGTLWATKMDFSRLPHYTMLNDWHRVGKRSDWITLAGIGTAYGLTADGTVWTWGAAWGQEGVTPLSSKMRIFENRIRGWLGFAPGKYSTGGFIPIQKEPRPLITFQSSPSAR